MNIVALILSAFFGVREPVKAESRLPPPEDVLSGMPLEYLIGTSAVQYGRAGRLTEVAYDVDVLPSLGIGVGYCNLFDENNTGKYGPYLHDSDTAAEYGEGQIDPSGTGWEKNLAEQFRRRQKAGFRYIELDNPDAYKARAVNGAVSRASQFGLRVLAKNPVICDDPESYLAHANVYGAIVEKGAGTPGQMEELRRKVGRPHLPVWFVYFGSTSATALEAARTIRENGYRNMGVTFSSRTEYGSSQDVYLPVKP
jgi:hypothetical protein